MGARGRRKAFAGGESCVPLGSRRREVTTSPFPVERVDLSSLIDTHKASDRAEQRIPDYVVRGSLTYCGN